MKVKSEISLQHLLESKVLWMVSDCHQRGMYEAAALLLRVYLPKAPSDIADDSDKAWIEELVMKGHEVHMVMDLHDVTCTALDRLATLRRKQAQGENVKASLTLVPQHETLIWASLYLIQIAVEARPQLRKWFEKRFAEEGHKFGLALPQWAQRDLK